MRELVSKNVVYQMYSFQELSDMGFELKMPFVNTSGVILRAISEHDKLKHVKCIHIERELLQDFKRLVQDNVTSTHNVQLSLVESPFVPYKNEGRHLVQTLSAQYNVQEVPWMLPANKWAQDFAYNCGEPPKMWMENRNVLAVGPTPFLATIYSVQIKNADKVREYVAGVPGFVQYHLGYRFLWQYFNEKNEIHRDGNRAAVYSVDSRISVSQKTGKFYIEKGKTSQYYVQNGKSHRDKRPSAIKYNAFADKPVLRYFKHGRDVTAEVNDYLESSPEIDDLFWAML